MDVDVILARIRVQAAERAIRITDHAREEMGEESITLAEVLEAIANVPVPPKWIGPTERRSK